MKRTVGIGVIVLLMAHSADGAIVALRSGQVLTGTVLQTVVQVCGSRASDIEVVNDDDRVRVTGAGKKGDLKPGGAALLLSANGVLIRTIPGQFVDAINETGVASREDRAFYLFMNGDIPVYPAITTILSDVRDWFNVSLKPNLEMLVASFSPTSGVFGFVSGDRLDQSKCRLVGSVLVHGGSVRVLPTLDVSTAVTGTLTIPVEDVAHPDK